MALMYRVMIFPHINNARQCEGMWRAKRSGFFNGLYLVYGPGQEALMGKKTYPAELWREGKSLVRLPYEVRSLLKLQAWAQRCQVPLVFSVEPHAGCCRVVLRHRIVELEGSPRLIYSNPSIWDSQPSRGALEKMICKITSQDRNTTNTLLGFLAAMNL